jgi:hypothetical protein
MWKEEVMTNLKSLSWNSPQEIEDNHNNLARIITVPIEILKKHLLNKSWESYCLSQLASEGLPLGCFVILFPLCPDSVTVIIDVGLTLK